MPTTLLNLLKCLSASGVPSETVSSMVSSQRTFPQTRMPVALLPDALLDKVSGRMRKTPLCLLFISPTRQLGEAAPHVHQQAARPCPPEDGVESQILGDAIELGKRLMSHDGLSDPLTMTWWHRNLLLRLKRSACALHSPCLSVRRAHVPACSHASH